MDTMAYTVRDGNVYFGKSRLKTADPETFEVMNEHWAKDSRSVYFEDQRLANVNPDSFVLLNNLFARDMDSIYCSHGAIGEIASPATFTVLDDGLFPPDEFEGPSWYDHAGYARDHLQVYFFCRMDRVLKTVKSADPESFIVLTHGFAKDHKSCYWRGRRIPGAAPESFELLSRHYGRDQKNVFYLYLRLANVQRDSFQTIAPKYGRDNLAVFCQNQILEHADPASFASVGPRPYMFRDKNHVYVHAMVDPKVDGRTLEYLGGNYYRDKKQIYWKGQPVDGADRDSFVVIGDDSGRDLTHDYFRSWQQKADQTSTFQDPLSLDAIWSRINSVIEPFQSYQIAIGELRKIPPGYGYVFAVHHVDTEIRNGGISQLYANSTWPLIGEAYEGAERLGMKKVANTLAEIIGYYHKSGRSRLLRRLGKERLATLPVNHGKSLEQLDDQYYELFKDGNSLDRALVSSISSHVELFM